MKVQKLFCSWNIVQKGSIFILKTFYIEYIYIYIYIVYLYFNLLNATENGKLYFVKYFAKYSNLEFGIGIQINFSLKTIEIASFKHSYTKLTLLNRPAFFLHPSTILFCLKHNKLSHKNALRAHTVRQLKTTEGNKDKKHWSSTNHDDWSLIYGDC